MSASSLIFFVILAVWAATMLKHWVRRREDLATARTVDRFSEAMRMLERRTPVKADVSARSDEPKRTILRPQVSVKGASRAAHGASAAPHEVDAQGATHDGVETAAARTAGRAAGVAAVASRGAAALASPKVKLAALAGSFGFFVLTALLALVSLVPAWMPVLGLLATAGVVVWLRRSAVAARAARVSAPVARPASRPVAKAAGGEARAPRATRPASGAESAGVSVTKRSPLVADLSQREESADAVFDREPDVDAVARAEAEVFDAAAWAPVDVPRPTYTMKAKAEREPVAPAATVDEVDERPLAARYENTPVEDLPFDGMALDEDYEELPQVYRAG